MNEPCGEHKFIDHYLKSQVPAAKAERFEPYFGAIRRELERVGAWRAEGLRVLDIGSGLGYYSELFQARGMDVTGVDIDPNLVDCARKRADQNHLPIRYEVAPCHRLPFADGSFDVVFSNSLLEHVPAWVEAVEEWIRVLAPMGALWIQTTNVLHPRQAEFRWLPLYSWWPAFMKKIAVLLACGPFPALANYAPHPAVHWFSFFQLRRFLVARGTMVCDRFDCMAPPTPGTPAYWARRLAQSSEIGRWLAQTLVPALIVIAIKQPAGDAMAGEPFNSEIAGRPHEPAPNESDAGCATVQPLSGSGLSPNITVES
jgi:2-polyprenyl-6-hydroxyphenyl methylase/3-demethylubiquinone-9 3-methyltransferase